MSFFKELQRRYIKGTIVEKLIYINLFVFLITLLSQTVSELNQVDTNFVIKWFSLYSDYEHLFSTPWSILTYGFLHADFLHILSNLIGLYFIGNLFIQYFTQKQLLTFYMLGTFFGGMLFLAGINYFPAFKNQLFSLVGASAGISAIIVGIATHIPQYQFKIRFIGFVKLWYIAAIWVLFVTIQLSSDNAGGHFAHLGGALFGYLYVRQAGTHKKTPFYKSIFNLFKIKRTPLRTVYKSKTKPTSTFKSMKTDHQKKIDIILEKISKSGYDTLSSEEKAFLFKQGKK
ncbi:MAG: rhomboid family intramembrane serine protease [Flavobacteriaceae bacterium]|nr:MAG: rhomboid family intramembrane serine protease [Flavobacteriaceae bacterium]